MKSAIVLVVLAVAVTAAVQETKSKAAMVAKGRSKRAAYELPDGVEFIVGSVKTSFQCQARNGYFADVDNNCQIFHVCNVVTHADGNTEVQQYSFFCGNQTVFNQLTLTCAFPEEAVPCQNAPDFFYVNDNIGIPDAPFLTDADVEKGAQLYSGYGQRAAAASNRLETRVPISGRGSHNHLYQHQQQRYFR